VYHNSVIYDHKLTEHCNVDGGFDCYNLRHVMAGLLFNNNNNNNNNNNKKNKKNNNNNNNNNN